MIITNLRVEMDNSCNNFSAINVFVVTLPKHAIKLWFFAASRSSTCKKLYL